MTYAEDLSGVDRWASVRSGLPQISRPSSDQRLLVIAAHPDDETLGAGGLLVQADECGASTTVVVATDGDASHPRSPTHRPRDLASVRRREVYAALAVLAPSAEVVLLGLPDGRLAGLGQELKDRLQPLLEASTLVVSPWIDDLHPDHRACSAAVRVLRGDQPHWQYPIWAWHWDNPTDPRFPRSALRALPLTDKDVVAKAHAIACFHSQCAPLSDEPGDETVLAPGMLAHFSGDHEIFIID